jgi:hypothetical protein
MKSQETIDPKTAGEFFWVLAVRNKYLKNSALRVFE